MNNDEEYVKSAERFFHKPKPTPFEAIVMWASESTLDEVQKFANQYPEDFQELLQRANAERIKLKLSPETILRMVQHGVK